MFDYREYCPIAKAAEILCERWTVLIVREMLMGAKRFNELRRYLPRISPSLLKSRLRSLETQGIITRLKIPALQAYEYRLTPAGRELESVVMALGVWAVRWQYASMAATDVNVDALMRDVEASLVLSQLPRPRSVLRFLFTDLKARDRWFVVVDDGHAEACDEDRAFDVDVYLSGDRKTLADVLFGVITLRQALAGDRLRVTGDPAYVKRIDAWFGVTPLATAARAHAGAPVSEGV